MAANKFTISQRRSNCIGCGSCAMYSSQCWKINDQDGKADLIGGVQKGEAMVARVGLEYLDENIKAADACPMQIIKLNNYDNTL